MCESGSAGRQTAPGDGWGATRLSFCDGGDAGLGEGRGDEEGVLHDNTYICPTVLFFVVSGVSKGGEVGGKGVWGVLSW